ncbi:DUF4395 domain-containing protein [Segniliparus rugosus]|uniref:DUF4395 domain-containing protein n=1 Tax=Segniliparus rugosus (strain ATCC BAA-974 / DSM 45345 / CCUG 50838 / CIP 108380 / JCM 13579 / CDC 945) TaxID=679197 RepID=E5XV66_SEGRC|nr:DUF4395 domain-containing protein [Segniliparus rugosus]EFV11771.1 hypothetical protein HMPREF9336_03388 [Segniliparus rugosus ATCC BAA-974]
MTSPSADQVDVRGPRFAATITTVVIALVLVLSSVNQPAALAVLAAQTIVFATTAALGPKRGPYGKLFARLVAPKLGPTREREPVAPLRFAQLVGFLFGAVGVAGFALGLALPSSGATVVGVVATAFALVAAFLNAAFGLCLGCELYPLVLRLGGAKNSAPNPQPSH